MSGLSAGNGFAFGSGQASSVAIGTTTISGGTSGRMLYDNGGVFGEAAGVTTDGTNLTLGASSALIWSGRTRATSPADGNLLLQNNAASAFGLIQLGGTTASFPAIKRNLATVDIRLADDSAYATLNAGAIVSSGNISSGGGGSIYWTARTVMTSPADGNIMFRNTALNNFGLMFFGGSTASFPALKRSSAILQVRVGDDTAFAAIQGKLTTDTAYAAGTVVPTGYIVLYDSTGTAYRVPCLV